MERKLPLHAVHLRLLALGLMLLDHLWGTVVPGNDWMTFLGRMAFPIFAFQVAEGYYHTSNFKRYAGRLLVFALISEIPYNWMISSSTLFPFHQNTMFTMLLGLFGVQAMDQAKSGGSWIKALAVTVLVALAGDITVVDYGARGVLTVIAFGALRHTPVEKLGQVAAMVMLHWVLSEGRILSPWDLVEFPMQALAIGALVPIWLYNGEKGPRNKVLQIGSYAFYPVHMAVLHLIRTFW